MANATNELIDMLDGKAPILCATITLGDSWAGENRKFFRLVKNYTKSDISEFFKSLNIDYDSGFGSQELFGYVWLTDGTWLERGEYDGSEWWEYKVCPKIPKELE